MPDTPDQSKEYRPLGRSTRVVVPYSGDASGSRTGPVYGSRGGGRAPVDGSGVATLRTDHVSRADRMQMIRAELRTLGKAMADEALSDAEALIAKLREVAEAPQDSVPDGLRQECAKVAVSLDSSVTTMRQIQGRAV